MQKLIDRLEFDSHLDFDVLLERVFSRDESKIIENHIFSTYAENIAIAKNNNKNKLCPYYVAAKNIRDSLTPEGFRKLSQDEEKYLSSLADIFYPIAPLLWD